MLIHLFVIILSNLAGFARLQAEKYVLKDERFKLVMLRSALSACLFETSSYSPTISLFVSRPTYYSILFDRVSIILPESG